MNPFADFFADVFDHDPRAILARKLLALANAMKHYAQLLQERNQRRTATKP